MLDEATRVKDWESELKEELEKQTGRHDIEVTTSPYCMYDVLVSCAADKHPITNFYAAIQGDPSRVKAALEYATDMLRNWEVTQVMHDKLKKDCLPFYERLKREFPHMVLAYKVFDFDKHYVKVEKVEDIIVASFDLWPKMVEEDLNRLAFYLKDYEATLRRDNATSAGATYWWK